MLQQNAQAQQNQNHTAGNLRLLLKAAAEYIADLHTCGAEGTGTQANQDHSSKDAIQTPDRQACHGKGNANCQRIDGCCNGHDKHGLGGHVRIGIGAAFAFVLLKGFLEHVDAINHIRQGKGLDEAIDCAVSCLAGVMGRESAYAGSTVSWDQMSQSDLDYMQEKLELGPMDMSRHVVMTPGVAK